MKEKEAALLHHRKALERAIEESLDAANLYEARRLKGILERLRRPDGLVEIVEKYKEQGKSMKAFGIDINFLTEEELKACLWFLNEKYQATLLRRDW